MKPTPGALRALARVELRSLLRSKARSALIVVLIAIPVAAMSAANVLIHVGFRTEVEHRAQLVGSADLRIDARGKAGDANLRELPQGSTLETVAYGAEGIEARGLRLDTRCAALNPEGLAAASWSKRQGAWPRTEGEVAFSTGLLEVSGVALGDRVRLASDGREVEVVGRIDDPEDLSTPWLIVHPNRSSGDGGFLRHYVALPATSPSAPEAETGLEPIVARLRSEGLRVTTRRDARDLRDIVAAVTVPLFGVAFVEAAIVVAAALLIGLRRRQREIGLLGAVGADPPGILLSIVVSAAALAVVGCILGLLIGVGTTALLHPHLDGWTGRVNGPLALPVPELLVSAGIGILTAMAAALLPARFATRLDITAALSGRRPAKKPPGRWALFGLGMVLAGLGLLGSVRWIGEPLGMVAVIAGSVFGVLGLGICSPWILEQGALRASRLPSSWRLAVRDAGRFRQRNGLVVTAILAGMAVSVTLNTSIASIEVQDGGWATLREDQLRVVGPAAAEVCERIADSMPVEAYAELRGAHVDGIPVVVKPGRAGADVDGQGLVVGGPGLLKALGVEALAPGARLVGVAPGFEPGDMELCLETGASIASLGAVGSGGGRRAQSPSFVLSEVAAEELGIAPGLLPGRAGATWIVRLAEDVDQALLEQARQVAASLPGTSLYAAILDRKGPAVFHGIAMLLSMITGLLVVGVATALTAAESRNDQRTLVSLGASPGTCRNHVAARSGYLALLGCALALPAGLLPLVGASLGGEGLPLVFPWGEYLLMALGFPTLVYVGTWCLTPPARWVRSAG